MIYENIKASIKLARIVNSITINTNEYLPNTISFLELGSVKYNGSISLISAVANV